MCDLGKISFTDMKQLKMTLKNLNFYLMGCELCIVGLFKSRTH